MWGRNYSTYTFLLAAADKDENENDQWQAANQYGRVDKVLNLSVFTTMNTWDHKHLQHCKLKGQKRSHEELG